MSRKCISVPLAVLVIVATLLTSACGARAEYPAGDITWLVPFAPGGATDTVSRRLAQETEPILKGKFIITNKAGGGGALGTTEMIQAKPDGYTIGLTGIGTVGMLPLTNNLPYDGNPEGYQPIMSIVELPNALVVPADAPWQTLRDLMEDAKKRPNEIRLGSTGKLTAGDILIQELAKKTGTPVTNVPFTTGAGEATTALLGGHIDGLVTEPGPLLSHVKAGKLRVLAIMQGGRLPSLPDVPSAEEFGFKAGYPVVVYMIIGPKGMDKAVVDKLYASLRQAAESESFQQFAAEQAMRVSVMGPADLTKRINDCRAIYAEYVKELGIEKKQ